MEIETEEMYSDTIYRFLEYYPLFEKALDDGDICDEVRNFLAEDLDDCYSTLKELKDNILHVSVPKKAFSCHSSMIKFSRTDKVKGILLSKNFIENLKGIMTNRI